MQKTGWEIRSVDHIPIPLPTSGDIVRPQYESVMNKLHIWCVMSFAASLGLAVYLFLPLHQELGRILTRCFLRFGPFSYWTDRRTF